MLQLPNCVTTFYWNANYHATASHWNVDNYATSSYISDCTPYIIKNNYELLYNYSKPRPTMHILSQSNNRQCNDLRSIVVKCMMVFNTLLKCVCNTVVMT